MHNNKYCCESMAAMIKDKRISINYSQISREYYINLLHSKRVVQQINYCPWCGTQLPESLRDKYFEILEQEYKIEPTLDVLSSSNIPKEFKSDEWWKKRGL